MKFEVCNRELEQTIGTLKRKIEILEDQADGKKSSMNTILNKKTKPSQYSNNAYENQLQKINVSLLLR